MYFLLTSSSQSLLFWLFAVARRGSQPGRIGSSGGSNPKVSHQKRMMMAMRRHRLPLIMSTTSIRSWSPRTHTPVWWATEWVTTSRSSETSLLRWEHRWHIPNTRNNILIEPPLLLCYPCSWGNISTHNWYKWHQRANGAQTKMQFWPTLSKRTLCLPHGTGLASTRYWNASRKTSVIASRETRYSTDVNRMACWPAGGIQECLWLRNLCLG